MSNKIPQKNALPEGKAKSYPADFTP